MTMVKEKHRKLETVPEDRRGSLLHRSIVCGKSNGNLGEMKREIIVDDSLFISPLLLFILARFLSYKGTRKHRKRVYLFCNRNVSSGQIVII